MKLADIFNEATPQGTTGTTGSSTAPNTAAPNTAAPNTAAPTTTNQNGSTIGQAQTEPTTDTMGSDTTPAQKRQDVQTQIKTKNDEILQTRERAKAAQDEIAAAREAEKMANEELALLRKRLSTIK
jgi:hypothetical protein